eukprot:7441569-Prorocentrum_lima.AAC.1
MHITRFDPTSASSLMQKCALNALNDMDMHQGIQGHQECQNLHNRFDCHSPKPLRAAHLLFK